MFGGSTRLYEVVWEVKIDEGYSSLAIPMSFIFGEWNSSCIWTHVYDVAAGNLLYNFIGFLGKEWKLLDITDNNSDWNKGNLQDKQKLDLPEKIEYVFMTRSIMTHCFFCVAFSQNI